MKSLKAIALTLCIAGPMSVIWTTPAKAICNYYNGVRACYDSGVWELVDTSDGATLTAQCGNGASWRGWSDYFVRKFYRHVCGSDLSFR